MIWVVMASRGEIVLAIVRYCDNNEKIYSNNGSSIFRSVALPCLFRAWHIANRADGSSKFAAMQYIRDWRD